MKVLVVADIHLQHKLFDRAAQILRSGQAELAIQLGDLFDDWGCEYVGDYHIQTLLRAERFQQEFPNTLWIMGNHDYGYYHTALGRKESGHNVFVETTLKKLLKQMSEEYGIEQKIIHHVDNVIFSHAGLTSDWVAMLTLDGVDYAMDDYIETLVNNASPEELWNERSPIWARPQWDNFKMFSDCLQVVGHTPVEQVSFVDNILSTDVFSTHSNGTPIGEQRFVIVDTVKKTWEYAKEEEND